MGSIRNRELQSAMKESRTNRYGSALQPATAASKHLGYFRLGSEQSRAAARSLVVARQESLAEANWDRELDCAGLAERLKAARERHERGDASEHWEPINIPSGKENTIRGRLAARINAARARVRRHEAR